MGKMDAGVYASRELLLCSVTLAVTVGASYTIQRCGVRGVPLSGVAMVLGMIWGGLVQLLGDTTAEHISTGVSFSPEAFFFGILPPIIYAAGFNLKHKDFFRNFGSILLFAVVGTIISTLVFGICTYLLYLMGAISSEVFEDPLLECLIYGSLISAIDPVGTLSIFADLSVTPLLYNLVFGESVLNDAVSIVLFRVLSELHGTSQGVFKFGTIPYVLVQFVTMCLGSIVVGVLIACVTAALLKALELHKPPNETGHHGASGNTVVYSFSLLFLSAYLSYLVAEVLSFSGIMSLFFAGICHAHYCFYNITDEARITSTNAFETIAFLCEMFLYTYLGLQVVVMHHNVDWGLLVSGIPLCILSRATNIFPLAGLANRMRRIKIPFNMQLMQWAGGLRGAIAYALAINMPHGESGKSQTIETATLFIVVFTTLVFGTATGPLLTLLHLKGDTPPDGNYALMDGRASQGPAGGAESLPGTPHGGEAYEGFHKVWKHFDRHIAGFLRAERIQRLHSVLLSEDGLGDVPASPVPIPLSTSAIRERPRGGTPSPSVGRSPLRVDVIMEEFPPGSYEAPALLDT